MAYHCLALRRLQFSAFRVPLQWRRSFTSRGMQTTEDVALSPALNVRLSERKDPAHSTAVVALLTEQMLTQEATNPRSWLKPFMTAPMMEDFNAKAGKSIWVYGSEVAPRVLLVGMGSGDKNLRLAVRNAAHSAVSQIRQRKIKSAGFVLGRDMMTPEHIKAFTQSAVLSNYTFSLKTKQGDENGCLPLMESLDILCSDETQVSTLTSAAQQARSIAAGTLLARDLANTRADTATPDFMEEMARTIASKNSLALTVLKGSRLQSEGLRMIQAVGQAADSEPRLLILEYRGNASSEETIALVGKGVTFDSGGLNMKPTGSIEDMHLDKSGACAVLAAMQTIANLGLKQNVIGVLGLVENAVDSKSYKPYSILKSHKGLTVEVGNTDAEGRLVLADAYSYVQKTYKPTVMIDLATLTGACVVALGEYCGGLFYNDETLATDLNAAAVEAFEPLHRLPIMSEHSAELKSPVADLKSTGKGRYGGAITAAAFLKEFVEENTKWAHLDIAGPAMFSEPRGPVNKGGTGFGVALLAEYLLAQQKSSSSTSK